MGYSLLKKHQKSGKKLKLARLKKFDNSWQLRTLSSGLRLVHVPSTEDNRFYIGATIATGSRYEPRGALGISHLLEHMMFRGSKRYPTFKQLATEFEWLGGTWNAGTGHEHTEYYYSGSLQFADDAVELFAEFFLNPQFCDFVTEKKIINREIEGELNEFGLSTDIDWQMHRMIWPNSDLASPIMGSKESIDKITLQELRRYRAMSYQAHNTVICAVGGEDSDAILDLMTKCFLRMKTRKLPEPSRPVRAKSARGPLVKLVKNPDNEYQVQLSFRCGGEWSSKAVHYELITRILADGFCSRLGHRIREQLGMVYDIDAELTMFSDTGTIDIFANVELDRVEQFLREVFKILESLKTNGPKAKELERAKRRCLVDLELMPDDPDMIGFKLSWALLCGKKTSLVKSTEKVVKVSREDIQTVCQDVFRPTKSGLVLMGPENLELKKNCVKILKGSC